MRRNPFNQAIDKFKIKPHISSNNAKEEIAKKILKTYIMYWGTFLLWIFVSARFIPMVFALGAIMWVSGGILSSKLPQEASAIAVKTRQTILTYILGLLLFRFIISMINETPKEMWEIAFRMSLPDAFQNAFMGFISMSFVIAMFMGTVQYLNFLFQTYKFHRTEIKTSDYMQTVTRREDGK